VQQALAEIDANTQLLLVHIVTILLAI